MSAVTTDKAVSAAVVEILGSVKMAVAQLRLFPKDSPQVAKAASAAFQAISSYLEHSASLVLAGTGRGLLVNGQRLSSKDFAMITLEAGLVSLLLDAGVKSIAFRKGASLDEFVTFLDALTHKFWDVKEGKEINRRLRDARVLAVSVDEIEYVAVGEGDLVIKDAQRTLEAAGSRAADVLKTLEHLAESVVDPQMGAEGRLQIMRKLLEQDPTLLEKAKADPAGRGPAEKMPGFFSIESAREALGEIARLLPDEVLERQEALRRIGNAIIDAFRHDPRLVALMRRFLSEDAIDLMPVWMTEAFIQDTQESGPVTRAKALLALEADQQAAPLLDEAEALVRELVAAGRPDLAARLVARASAYLVDRGAERRGTAARTLLALLPSLDTGVLSAARDGLESVVRSAVDAERDPTAYGRLAELASLFADGRLRRGELEPAIETLDILRRHQTLKDAALAFRADAAVHALERVALGTGFSKTLARLRQGDLPALRVAEALGEVVVRHLVGEMTRIETTALRVPLAEVVGRMGATASAGFADELQKTTAPSDLLRLLEVLPLAAPEAVAIPALASSLRHPAIAVRRRSASILSERAYARSGDLLTQALKDEKDASIRVTLVDGLGKLRLTSSFETLAAIATTKSEPDEVRCAACVSLGRLGHAEAVPVLAELATKGGRGFGALLKPNNAAVRGAAIRGLGHFPTNAEARDALKKASEDSDAQLQATARETLFRPVPRVFATAGRELQQAAAVHEVKAGRVKLAGSLQEISFDQVCQLVGGSEKTGLLLLSLEGRVGRIWFEKGLVVAAEFERLRDQDAFNAFVRHAKGEFIFQPAEFPVQRRLSAPVHSMLLEAFRRSDEAR